MPAYAVESVFYGLDQSVGAGGAHPNADAARAAFLARLGNATIGIEGFEGDPLLDFRGAALEVSFAPLATMGLITDRSTFGSQVRSGAIQGNTVFPARGSQFLFSGTAGGTAYLDLELSSPQTAIGFYAVAFSNYAGAPGGPFPSIRISLGGGVPIDVFNVAPSEIQDYSVGFFGVVTDTPFSTVTISNPVGTVADEGGFDDFIIGQNALLVPEPGSFAFLACGLLLACAARRGAYRHRVRTSSQRQFRSFVAR